MQQRIYSEKGIILEKSIFGEFGIFKFSLPKIAESVIPGQFIMLKLINGRDPILARPFSVFDAHKGEIRLFIKRVGKITTKLFKMHIGETVNFLGPLGNGFKDIGDNVVLLGGGSGIAPLNFYGNRYGFTRFLVGFKTYIPVLDSILPEGVEVITEDGSFGKKGVVTDYISGKERIIYACGPVPMLKALEQKRWDALKNTYVSLESMMGCGFGVCSGCGVKKRKDEGYFRVCFEGPVFSFSRIAI